MTVLFLILFVSSGCFAQNLSYSGALWDLSDVDIPSLQRSLMKNFTDDEEDLCDDFFAFSCGGWREDYMPMEFSLSYSMREMAENDIRIVLSQMLLNKTIFASLKKSNLTRKIKIYYDSCMKIDAIKKKGLKPIRELITFFGSCPALNSTWKKINSNWVHLIVDLALLGKGFVIKPELDVNFYNSSQNIVHIKSPEFYFPRMYYYKKENKKDEYLEALKKILIELGVNEKKATRVAKDVFDFELELVSITTNPEDREESIELYKYMTIKELQISYPFLNWTDFMQRLQNTKINDGDHVMVDYKYLDKLQNLISRKKNVAKLIYNYVIINLALFSRRYVILNTDDINPDTRWETCADHAIENMEVAAYALFSQRYLSQGKIKDILDIADNLRKTFKKVIESSDWLDEDTKLAAILKLEAIDFDVGVTNYHENKKHLKSWYNTVPITANNFFKNSFLLINLKHRGLIRNLNDERTINTCGGDLIDVGACFDFRRNDILIQAGLLQLPYYHVTFPMYLKYGIVGTIIGHELVHAFDNVGRRYNDKGEVSDWWGDDASLSYMERALCFIDLYSDKYKLGKFTLPENIADNGGLKLAYLAYEDWLERNTSPENLADPNWERIDGWELNGQPITGKQLFFIGFTQWRCQYDLEGIIFSHDPEDAHPPEQHRIEGSLSNSKQFSSNFQCDLGSKFNPEEKCELW